MAVDASIHEVLAPYAAENIPVRISVASIPTQPKELYYGNREYKRHLILSKHHVGAKSTPCRHLEKRCTQLLFRINEGNGKALYLIGVEDNGQISGLSKCELIESLYTLQKIIKAINVKITKLNIYMQESADSDIEQKYCITIRFFKELKSESFEL